MGINQACELFGINDISNETEETLKNKFRLLSKKYHPDNSKTGDQKKFLDISTALELLKDTVKKLEKLKLLTAAKEVLTVVIPLDKLIDIYGGGNIVVGSGSNTKEIDKREMKKNNTLIISDVTIEHNGLVNVFDNVQPWNINDNYAITCNINVTKLSNTEKVKIKLLGKEKDIEMTAQSLKIKFTLQYNINVDVIINKKIIVENSST